MKSSNAFKATGLSLALAIVAAAAFAQSPAQPASQVMDAVQSAAKKEKPALIETLKELVAFESGSREIDELNRIGATLAGKLRALGGKVEIIEPAEATTTRLSDTPEKLAKMVRATFTGTGTKKILLVAHMDTVYPKGMLAKQPFRIDGDHAYGLAIADQRAGLATVLHTLAILKTLNYREYGTITVFFNPDEEIGSPGSRHYHTLLGSQHDAVMSFEGAGANDQLRLATSGQGAAMLSVRGRASHAGSAPEKGVNALDEMSHQILQMRNLSDPAIGVKVNWTLANAGVVANMIPPEAQARADVRISRLSDYDVVEQKLRERIRNKLLPESQVGLVFERRWPPLEPTAASRALSAHAQTIYAELGKKLTVTEVSPGGATDAAFASLKARGPVVEGFGLQGFGAHSTNAEYVVMSSIEPRLYLATRMIMDISSGKAPLAGKP